MYSFMICEVVVLFALADPYSNFPVRGTSQEVKISLQRTNARFVGTTAPPIVNFDTWLSLIYITDIHVGAGVITLDGPLL